MIYLRHGEPTHELHAVPGAPEVQRIAWTYSRPGPVQPVFEFDRGPDRADYFLAEPYPICNGAHVRSSTASRLDTINFGYPVAADLVDWSTRLHAFDPSLATYYRNCDRGPGLAQLSYVHLVYQAQRHGAEMLNSENAAPRLKHPLTASMNLYAFAAGPRAELGIHRCARGRAEPAGQSDAARVCIPHPVRGW
jgi:hypothetical protein